MTFIAPRPVFISSGSLEVDVGWIDAKGMFLAVVYAGPVFKLLSKNDLGTTAMPIQETVLTTTDNMRVDTPLFQTGLILFLLLSGIFNRNKTEI